MIDQSETPRAGHHRRKRNVDRLWLTYQIKNAGMTVAGFGEALARATSRGQPLDKASASRRLSGHIPFTASEVDAMCRMFNVPLDEMLRRVGSSANDEPVAAGTIVADGTVHFDLAIAARHHAYRLRLAVQDGWAGAIVTVNAARLTPLNAGRGIYIIHATTGEPVLRQFLGVHGKQILLAAPFDTSTPVEAIPADAVGSMQRVTHIAL